MEQIIYAENQEWQRMIYDEPVAILILNNGYGTLLSNCGYIDLDHDSERCSKNSIDCAEYCEMKSIEELINYIKSMKSYDDFRRDISYGKFTKSELF